MTTYRYVLRLLEEVPKGVRVFVPNTLPTETLEIYRWFASGCRGEFPGYDDGALRITGVDEEAWLPADEYRAAYCPPLMLCIVRHPIKKVRKKKSDA